MKKARGMRAFFYGRLWKLHEDPDIREGLVRASGGKLSLS